MSTRSLINTTGQRVICPLYHSVNDIAPAHLKYLYSVKGINQFRADMLFLREYFEPIDLVELNEYVNKDKKVKKPVFHLTFDDGFSDFYDNVWPVLKEWNIPATLFINPAFVDNKNMYYRLKASLIIDNLVHIPSIEQIILGRLKEVNTSGQSVWQKILSVTYKDQWILDEIAEDIGFDFKKYLEENKPYLTTQQISEMVSEGLSIGGHSYDHPEYHALNYEGQIEQTESSLDFVKNTFKPPVKAFAFPLTDDEVTKKWFDYFYVDNNKLDLSFGTAGIKHDFIKNHIQRIPMEVDGFDGHEVIRGEYIYYMIKRLTGKNKITRK
jgi:peptidoglycan/xylan/chitin deacetylase (PgdA/CDA1 family)